MTLAAISRREIDKEKMMTFVYEPITDADRERMKALKIMIRYHPVHPHQLYWTVSRTTGDFFVEIAEDREPPNYTWFAFWWRNRLYRVDVDRKTTPATGYRIDIAAIADTSGARILREEWPELSAALFDATKTYAAGDANGLFARTREWKHVPPLPDAQSVELDCTFNDMTTTPHAIFRAAFPKDIA